MLHYFHDSPSSRERRHSARGHAKLRMTRTAHICLVAHSSYGEMASITACHIGGIQRQQSLMARWLAGQGHQVTMLTRNEGVLTTNHRGRAGAQTGARRRRTSGAEGFPSTMDEAHCRDAARECGCLLSQQRRIRDRTSRPVVPDDAGVRLFHRARFRLRTAVGRSSELAREGALSLRSSPCGSRDFADADPAENAAPPCQGSLDGIAMPTPLSARQPVPLEQRAHPPRIVWVGRIARNKRLEMFLDMAASAPEFVFEVAGEPKAGSSYGDQVVARGKSMPNVIMHGRVGREQMPDLYGRSLPVLHVDPGGVSKHLPGSVERGHAARDDLRSR